MSDDDDPQAVLQAQRKRRRRVYVLTGVVLVLAGGVLGGGIYTAYQVGYAHGKQAAAPVISSDSEAVRIQPEDEGGRSVDNTDSEVYSLLSQNEDSPENLLVPEKEAASQDDTVQLEPGGTGNQSAATGNGQSGGEATQTASAGQSGGQGESAAGGAGSGGSGGSGNAIESEKLKEPQAGESGEIENLIKEEVKEKTTPEQQKQTGGQDSGATGAASGTQTGSAQTGGTATADSAADTGTPASGGESGAATPESKPSEGSGSGSARTDGSASGAGSASGSGSGTQVASKPQEPQAKWRIQIGSVPKKAAAQKEWQRLQDRYSDLLGGLKAKFRRADLGADGIYHRIQVGPLSESKARELCAQLSQKGQGCLVVAP